jgi:PAS domain-containing protein
MDPRAFQPLNPLFGFTQESPMEAESFEQSQIFRAVFDALPSWIFVVDSDVRIRDYNAAAAKFLSGQRQAIIKRRGGEVLNCLHSHDVMEGCGQAAFCKHCVIRNSVTEAFQGNHVVRRRRKIEILREGEKMEIYALISASPFVFEKDPLVLLVIEDISIITELQRMISICSVCKKIRDEKQTWSQLELYFKERWDVDFSHGLCPECFQSEMKKLEAFKA